MSARTWTGACAFETFSEAHPKLAGEYAALKRTLAAWFREDREGFTNAKSAFIRDAYSQPEASGRAAP